LHFVLRIGVWTNFAVFGTEKCKFSYILGISSSINELSFRPALTYIGLNRTYHAKYWAKPYAFLPFRFLCKVLAEGFEERVVGRSNYFV